MSSSAILSQMLFSSYAEPPKTLCFCASFQRMSSELTFHIWRIIRDYFLKAVSRVSARCLSRQAVMQPRGPESDGWILLWNGGPDSPKLFSDYTQARARVHLPVITVTMIILFFIKMVSSLQRFFIYCLYLSNTFPTRSICKTFKKAHHSW